MFEIDQIIKHSILHCTGRGQAVFENFRGPLTYARRAAGCISLFYRLHLEDRTREGEQ